MDEPLTVAFRFCGEGEDFAEVVCPCAPRVGESVSVTGWPDADVDEVVTRIGTVESVSWEFPLRSSILGGFTRRQRYATVMLAEDAE